MQPMKITITKITNKEKPVLANLLKMYCYEWSQYNLFDVNEAGEYPFEKYLDSYFNKPKRYNYFIRVNNILAGFALIDDDFPIINNADYSLGEFFIMYKYRRLGIGTYFCEYLFNKYPGKWQVGFHPHNLTSVSFWTKVINEYTHGKYECYENCKGLLYHDGTLGTVFTFDNTHKNNIE